MNNFDSDIEFKHLKLNQDSKNGTEKEDNPEKNNKIRNSEKRVLRTKIFRLHMKMYRNKYESFHLEDEKEL